MIDQLFHSFFNFLGEPQGNLLLATIDFMFFLFATYMISSEYKRNHKKELFVLILAFATLTISKAVSITFLSIIVFTDIIINITRIVFLLDLFQIFALFLVVNAFVYPILVQKKYKTKLFIFRHLLLLGFVIFLLTLFVLSIIDLQGFNMSAFIASAIINVSELVILTYYASFILVNNKCKLQYKSNILMAFLIYSVHPVIILYSIILTGSFNRTLMVAAQPFPLISLMFFMRIVYFKLVNKATILDKLRKSQQLYAKEKEISKLKDHFISTVSHELKTPLTSMKLYVHLLQEKKLGPVTKKQKDSLSIIDSEVTRLNNLITDILDLSKLEANKTNLSLSEFHVSEILNHDLYLTLAKKKGVNVEINHPENYRITADKDKLQQVYINLFNNALKFTPEGGSIVFNVTDQKKDWEFCIADTGEGISKETIPKLFSRFYQAEDVMTRKQGGFGLGLSIVKGIVDLHKGKINVESDVGKGTKISIRFPKLVKY